MNKHEMYLAAVKSNLKIFLLQVFGTLYPDKQFLDNWHIDAIIYLLEQCIEGKQRRLIINLPPRQLKSVLVSVVLPAFILGHDPSAKIICVSYSDELGRTLARDFRRIVESEWYRRIFSDVRPIKMTEGEFVTEQGGGRFAISVGGSLTGRGGDFIIIDDAAKPEDMYSDKTRESINNWYQSTLLSRLDDKKLSVLILVMQRLHVHDLTGHVEESGGYYKLSLPAIAEQDQEIRVSETEIYSRKAGEVLHAEREDLATLEGIRNQMQAFHFAAQYQQRPTMPDGIFFKLDYFKRIASHPVVEVGGLYWISVDSAFATSDTADYSVICVGYSNLAIHTVLEVDRGRWEFDELRRRTFAFAKRLPGATVIVEKAGSGVSLLQSLLNAGMKFFPFQPRNGKMHRAALALPMASEGRVQILDVEGRNEWVEPFLSELVTFPNGRFDDQVDALVQALLWAELRVRPGGGIYF